MLVFVGCRRVVFIDLKYSSLSRFYVNRKCENMDELMQQMADKFGDMIQAVIIEKTKVLDIDQTLP